MAEKTGGYARAPEIPAEVERRLHVIQQVSAGLKTMSEAATELGLSRVQTQSLVHRSQAGAAAALVAKPPGRPRRSPEEKARERELTRLRRENQKLQGRLAKMEHVLVTAAEVFSGRMLESRQVWARERKPRPQAAAESPKGESDKPGGPAELLAASRTMKQQGLSTQLVGAVVGKSASTMRRWSRRQRRGQALCCRRGPVRAASCTNAEAGQVVRRLAGMIGAAALAKQTGLSRRQAAQVKASTITELERERKERSSRVTVTKAGIVRGFDQMYVWTTEGWRYPLVSADSSVPFRTSVLVAKSYDEESVLEALRADIAAWGAPLVYRMDRYSGHRSDKVKQLLEAHGVLVLHGPAHHPCYYGQLERMNQEHRHYFAFVALLATATLPEVCRDMIAALNTTWPRRALGWRTPAELWAERQTISAEERAEFYAEVYDRRNRITKDGARDLDLAMRLAIEQALQQRGYLQVERPNGAN